MNDPAFRIDIRKFNNPDNTAAREKIGVDVAFFFPHGTIVVNAATPEQEEEWCRRAGDYAMPATIHKALAESYSAGKKDGIRVALAAVHKVLGDDAYRELISTIDRATGEK
jgi:hypothetical protein